MANQYRSVLASSEPAPTGGDAVASEVLSGKTFTNDNGLQTGTMVNRGAVSGTATPTQPYTIPEGYHNGQGVVNSSAGKNNFCIWSTSNILFIASYREGEAVKFTRVGSTGGAATIDGITFNWTPSGENISITASNSIEVSYARVPNGSNTEVATTDVTLSSSPLQLSTSGGYFIWITK